MIDIFVAIIISFAAAVVWTWAYGFSRDASFDGKITYDTKTNKLTIEYNTTNGPPVVMTGTIGKSAEEIVNEIKQAAAKAPPNAKTYYAVTHIKSNIRYYFKLSEDQARQLTTSGGAITEADASIIVQYGNIFTEGFSDTDAKSSMISPLMIVLVGMGLAYGFYRDTKKDVTTYHEGPKVESKGLKPENLTAENITNITVTGTDGKSTTYNKAGPETTPGPGTPSLTIKKDGEVGEGTNATFTKQVGTATVKGT